MGWRAFEKVVVGAAGFEPTTCSTQNCRATRLRYTPIISINDVDTRLNRDQQGAAAASMATKKRMRHAVAGRDAVFLRGAGDHFQHPFRQSARRDDLGRERFGVLSDSQDPAVGPDE